MTKLYPRTLKAFALVALALSASSSLSAQTCNKTISNNGNPPAMVSGDVVCITTNGYNKAITIPAGVTVYIQSGGSDINTITVQNGGTLIVQSGGSYSGAITVQSGGQVTANIGATWNPSSVTNSGTVTILPIILQSFTATANGNAAELHWSTASELSGKAMIVQHSVDGVNFEDIKEVASTANSTSVKNYSYTDYNATNGVNYYRLKLVSSDGPATYSAVVAVKVSNSASASVAVYPTAFGDHFTIKLNEVKSSNVVVKLYNDQGVVVLVKTLSGSATQIINTPANLSTGLYILEVNNGSDKSFSRLVKL